MCGARQERAGAAHNEAGTVGGLFRTRLPSVGGRGDADRRNITGNDDLATDTQKLLSVKKHMRNSSRVETTHSKTQTQCWFNVGPAS